MPDSRPALPDREPIPMIPAEPLVQLLIQLSDRDTLAELLDAQPLRAVARKPGCSLFVIESGRVTRVLNPDETPGVAP